MGGHVPRRTVVVNGVDTARLREAAAYYREPGAPDVTLTSKDAADLLEAVALAAEISRIGQLISGLFVAARIADSRGRT